MILSQFFTGSYSSSTSTSTSTNSGSTEVLAKVSKIMEAQKTNAPALNAALSSDNTKLSGLGKLLNALTTFQSTAQSFSKAGAATPTAVQDSTQLTKSVTDLVSKYNALNANLNGLRKGELKSDSVLSSIQSQLARVFNSSSSSAVDASSLTLGSIGISTQSNGTLAVDATKLQNAIKSNPDGVAKLFSNGGKGIADNLASQIQGMVSSTGGIEKEKAALNKDITTLNAKRSTLEKTLTAQANALVKFYSQQSSSGSLNGHSTLFDMLGR